MDAALRRWLAQACPQAEWSASGEDACMVCWEGAEPRWKAAGLDVVRWRVVARATSRDGRRGVCWLRRDVAQGDALASAH